MRLAISPGWHISSLTTPGGGPMRTEIALAPNQPFALAGKIAAPELQKEHSRAFDADVEYYTGTVVFTLPLETTSGISPGTKIVVEITCQACNDETCLLPTTQKVTAIIANPADTKR